MFKTRSLLLSVLATATLFAYQPPTVAQQSQDWFVPGQGQRPAAGAPAAPRQPARPPTAPGQGAPQGLGAEAAGPEAQPQQVQVQLPPPPEVPALPKGPTPPAAIVGVLSVPDVMRASTAYQQADKELGVRRQKLNEDAQKEQVALRDLGQALANERAKLTADQIRNRERELQDRITESRRTFGERNRIIQESGQYVMAQIDRAVELVTQQVSISRGINLVLNRAQILGTTSDFDLTPQVVDDLNKVLPSVVIPPDGVSPVALQPQAGATPASAPAASPAAAAPKPPAKPPAPPQPLSQPQAQPQPQRR